jgi:hypothetical protein
MVTLPCADSGERERERERERENLIVCNEGKGKIGRKLEN